jgi:hypothetical protein
MAIDELELMRSYIVHAIERDFLLIERDFLLGVGSTMLLASIPSTMSPLTAFEISNGEAPILAIAQALLTSTFL